MDREGEERIAQKFEELCAAFADGADSRSVTADGVVVPAGLVEYAYTREGRKEVGKEFPNPVPMEAPIGQVPHEPIWEMIKRMVLEHARKEAGGEEEMETEAEADDFQVGDDYDPSSPWEEHHEPTDPWPMSSAARQLEQAIAEKRNQGRIAVLQEELEALQQGKEWPPKPVESGPASPPPAGPPPAPETAPKPAK